MLFKSISVPLLRRIPDTGVGVVDESILCFLFEGDSERNFFIVLNFRDSIDMTDSSSSENVLFSTAKLSP